MGTGVGELTAAPAVRPFKILSLDGGGIRGAFAASALASLEARFNVSMVNYFDLIAGTSTGAIIALGLAAGIPASSIKDFYCSHGPAIFRKLGFARRLARFLTSVIRPKHSQDPLRLALEGVFGAQTMSTLRTRTVIPAFDVSAGRIRLFKTPHHPHITSDGARRVVDVALASSAAPYFLPGFVAPTGERYIDGGIWANDPVAVAVVEAVGYLDFERSSVRVFSVGTTGAPVHASKRSLSTGLVGLRGAHPMDLLMKAQSSAAQAQAKVLLGGKASIVRIDETVAAGRFVLDRSADIEDLCGLGESAATQVAPEVRRLFLDMVAQHPYRTAPLTSPS